MAKNKEMGRIGQRRYNGIIYEEFLPELRGKRGIATSERKPHRKSWND